MASRLFLRSALSLRRASRCASSSSSSSFRFVSSSGFCSSSGTPGFHPLPVSDAAVGIEQPAPESSLVVDRSGLFNTPGPNPDIPVCELYFWIKNNLPQFELHCESIVIVVTLHVLHEALMSRSLLQLRCCTDLISLILRPKCLSTSECIRMWV